MEKIEMGKGVLVPSYKCNQRCSCCYAMADIVQAKQTMSLEEAKKSIDFFEMIGIKTYTILSLAELSVALVFLLDIKV